MYYVNVMYQGQEEEHKYDKHDYKFCGEINILEFNLYSSIQRNSNHFSTLFLTVIDEWCIITMQ